MSSHEENFHIAHHDWHSPSYVSQWIAQDAEREEERRPMLRRMLALAPFPQEAAIRVLDVGGGYGIVTEEVLRAFPQARVTVQDYSEQMLEHARRHLSTYSGQIGCVLCDLRDRSWTERVDGPFDLVVSAIAIHNLHNSAAIAECYRGIHSVLRSGGVFLNCDHFQRVGGVEAHLKTLEEAGFQGAECPWRDSQNAIIKGVRGAAETA